MLDMLCLAGDAGWGRLSSASESGSSHVMRVALFLREHGDAWQTLRFAEPSARNAIEQELDAPARAMLAALREKGASFLRDLVPASGLDPASAATAIAMLAAAGLVTSDGFAGARACARALRKPALFDRRHDLA